MGAKRRLKLNQPVKERKEKENMAVKIRLLRMGAKKKSMYRIVAADARAPRDGNFLEIVGTYNPHAEQAGVAIKPDLLQKWLKCGAQPTDTVRSLLKANNLWPAAN